MFVVVRSPPIASWTFLGSSVTSGVKWPTQRRARGRLKKKKSVYTLLEYGFFPRCRDEEKMLPSSLEQFGGTQNHSFQLLCCLTVHCNHLFSEENHEAKATSPERHRADSRGHEFPIHSADQAAGAELKPCGASWCLHCCTQRSNRNVCWMNRGTIKICHFESVSSITMLHLVRSYYTACMRWT